jgi:flagellar hook-length control protein FliK
MIDIPGPTSSSIQPERLETRSPVRAMDTGADRQDSGEASGFQSMLRASRDDRGERSTAHKLGSKSDRTQKTANGATESDGDGDEPQPATSDMPLSGTQTAANIASLMPSRSLTDVTGHSDITQGDFSADRHASVSAMRRGARPFIGQTNSIANATANVTADRSMADTAVAVASADTSWTAGVRINRFETHRAPSSIESGKLTAVLDQLGNKAQLQSASVAQTSDGTKQLTNVIKGNSDVISRRDSIGAARGLRDGADQSSVAADKADAPRARKSERGDADTTKVAPPAPEAVTAKTDGRTDPSPELGTFGSPARQITHAVSESLSAASRTLSSGLEGAAGDGAPPGAGRVVRVLEIDLHPGDLGTVKVRLALNGDSLSIDIVSEKRTTARLLENDRDALNEQLKQPGQILEVSIAAADASQDTGAQTDRNSDPNKGMSSWSPGHQAQDGRPDDRAQREQVSRAEASRLTDRAGDGAVTEAGRDRPPQTGVYV